MKKILLYILMLVSIKGISQNGKSYTLSGTIHGKESGYLYMLVTDLYEIRTKDSALIIHGRFEFKGVMPHPLMAFIFDGSSPKSMNDPNAVSFMLDPGKTLAVLQYGDFKSIELTGAKTQTELNGLEKLRTDRRSNNATADAAALQRDLITIDLNFIREHPASYASVYLLRSGLNGVPLAEKEKYLNALIPELQQSGYGKFIRSAVSSQKLGVPGTKATGFTSMDINGNTLSLSDFKGKYVLLDFWASWCIPCRKGNPHLLEVYTKYKGRGFEIIGISDDDGKEEAWRKAIEKDGIGVWKHVLRGIDMKKVSEGDLNFSHHASEISSSKYAVTGLPTKILIDPSGNIIGRYSGGAGDEATLDEKLAEIFKSSSAF